MSLYDNEENAIVNNANDTSETPSNLVNESPDQEYNKNGAKLSPNPAGFGFIKQLFVTPENTATNGEPNLPGEPNVLYLVQVLNDGLLVGYRKYKWTPSDGFVQFGASPDLKLKDSPRETPTRVENEPKKNLAQVFNGDIAVNGDLFVKGQKVEGSSDPLTPSQVVDIVNEGIEGGDITIPSGTKLYKHSLSLGGQNRWIEFSTTPSISISDVSASTSKPFIIISTTSTPYTNVNSIIQDMPNILKFFDSQTGRTDYILNNSSPSRLYVIAPYYDESTTGFRMLKENITAVGNDTVTEL